MNQDFRGQGITNIVCSLLQCAPASGSLSATALNVSTGAETWAANIFSGIIVGLLILALRGQVDLGLLCVLDHKR